MGDYTLNGIHYKEFCEWEQAYFKDKKAAKKKDKLVDEDKTDLCSAMVYIAKRLSIKKFKKESDNDI